MLTVHIICVGKLKEAYLRAACAEYEKRLSAYCRLTVTEVAEARMPENPSPAQIEAGLREEGERILAKSPMDRKLRPYASRAGRCRRRLFPEGSKPSP